MLKKANHHLSLQGCNLFAGGWYYLQFVKKKPNTISVKHNKVEFNKVRYTYNSFLTLHVPGDSVRSHGIRAQSHKTAPLNTSDANHRW